MCTRLRGLLFLLPSALAVAVAVADANAALEPAGWGDLDGWAGDDHASAFATFYASCRPIVRMIAFRAVPLVYMEDIGRHNAVDKTAGWMFRHGVSAGDKIFYTTGRLTSEMVGPRRRHCSA